MNPQIQPGLTKWQMAIPEFLGSVLKTEIHPAPGEWEILFSLDYYIRVDDKYIGLQISPVGREVYQQGFNQDQWRKMHKKIIQEFEDKFGGRMFLLLIGSDEGGKKKLRIYNLEVVDQIHQEIKRLKTS